MYVYKLKQVFNFLIVGPFGNSDNWANADPVHWRIYGALGEMS